MKDSKLKTAGIRKLHWGKAVVSIVVTLAAMPLTHSLARVLKEGTTGVEQFYAGMGMGAFGLFMVIAGVFVKGHIRQTLLGLFGGMFYWMGAVDFLFMYFANRFGTQAQAPQDEFTKIDAKKLPDAVMNALAKSYEGASIKEVYSADKETGKIYKVILTTKDSQEVTVLLDEKGEEIKEA